MSAAASAHPRREPAETATTADIVALQRRLWQVEEHLREANETIEALRAGDVDAIVVHGRDEPQIYTLANDDRPYRRLIEQIGEGALTLTDDGVILYCNGSMADLVRMPHEKVIGGKLQHWIAAGDRGIFDHLLARGGGRGVLTLLAADGSMVPVNLSLTELVNDGTRTLCAVLTDLTDLKQAETALREAHARLVAEIAEREEAEAKLRQAQKMEAVGQLTGGVAHDFNNLLTVIIGGLEMIGRQVPALPAGPHTARIGRGVSMASMGADRAAMLVQRLLAFSRRQALDPRPVDANRLVAGMFDILHRTLGETIELQTVLAERLWQAQADPHQLESSILNLAVNARDASPDGGRLTITTANRVLGIRPDPLEPDTLSGDYVMIAVADTGTGMDQRTLERAFEPFFTTKDVGSGTGLGLSQVYGFAKQSKGHVAIRSAPGEGTTVELYLPRRQAEAAAADAAREQTNGATGSVRGETVLVVEDNHDVRLYSTEALRELGYGVLEAGDGASALELLGREAGVSLLFSDIGLPGGMNGRQLAAQALQLRQGLKVLLTTGYAQQVAGKPGGLDAEVHVITKPFTFGDLASCIRRILDGQLPVPPV